MEITTERFTELIVAEHNYHKLCKIIRDKADSYDKLENSELKILKEMCCPHEDRERGDDFPCL